MRTNYDRGDTIADWPCRGTVLIDLPPEVVAEWAPSGSVVERVTADQTRFILGAWSWAGVAGLLATFDADIVIVEPEELKDACRTLARRFHRAARTAGGR